MSMPVLVTGVSSGNGHFVYATARKDDDLEAPLVNPLAAVVVAEIRHAGIITDAQAERAWWKIALGKGLLTTRSGH